MDKENPMRHCLAVALAVGAVLGPTLVGCDSSPSEEKKLLLPQRDPPVYIPTTISEEAQAVLKRRNLHVVATLPALHDLDGWKRAQEGTESGIAPRNRRVVEKYEPTITRTEIGGVPVLDIVPKGWVETPEVLVYTHGGIFTLFNAESTLFSSVPMAHDTRRRVISIDCTLAPFAKWPEVMDQVVAVVRGLLTDGRNLRHLAIYGEAGGVSLAAGSVLKMRDQGLGLLAAVVLLSPWSDITETGDTYHTLRYGHGNHGDPFLDYENTLKTAAAAYADPEDQKHPYVSPVYADYSKGFPPTLIQGGTKEIFLSNFVRHYQALDQAGIPVKLDLYEGMWNAFQAYYYDLPESELARKKVKAFLDEHVTD
jgi:acetyl esterase/lipase